MKLEAAMDFGALVEALSIGHRGGCGLPRKLSAALGAPFCVLPYDFGLRRSVRDIETSHVGNILETHHGTLLNSGILFPAY